MTQERWTAADYQKHLRGAPRKGSSKRNKKEEGNLSKAVEQYLDFNGFENDRINAGAILLTKKYTSKKTGETTEHTHKIRLAKVGTPDLWALYRSFWILIELKLKNGKPSEIQLERQAELRKAGALIINADTFESFLDQIQLIKTKIDNLFEHHGSLAEFLTQGGYQ